MIRFKREKTNFLYHSEERTFFYSAKPLEMLDQEKVMEYFEEIADGLNHKNAEARLKATKILK